TAIAQLREECAERLERLFGLEVDRDFLLAANAAPLVRRHARQETVVLADKLALEVEPRKRNRLPGASEERRDPRHGGRIATGGEVRENVAGHFMIADLRRGTRGSLESRPVDREYVFLNLEEHPRS